MAPILGLLLLSVLPGTKPLETSGDAAAEMVAGMTGYLEGLTARSEAWRVPSAERLRFILGAVDRRAPFDDLELAGTLQRPALLRETADYRVYSVRWPVLDGLGAEGLYYQQKGTVARRVVALLDQPGDAESLAAAGADVLAPVLVPAARREWIYRMAFPVGRHVYGYEVQTALAAVDWLSRKGAVSIYGRGEGAYAATYAAALDPRLAQVDVEGFSLERPPLWKQPLYRNVFGLLKDFGDAQFATMLGGRTARLPVAKTAPPVATPGPEYPVRQMQDYTQRLIAHSEQWRDALWKTDGAAGVAKRFVEDVIGVLPGEAAPLNLRSRLYRDAEKWQAWEVRFDVRPGVFGQGMLLLPKDLRPGEKRPLVVVQHGLDGRASVLFDAKGGRELEVYRNFGAQLADLGYIVYSPQNPYVGEFRHLARLANPLGLSLYSLIREQYRVMLDWLSTLPQVDPARVGFYGLSYGGKTALRVPPFDERFRVVVCGGDFNEWIRKLTSPEASYSYMFTKEYEILEWNMAAVASHAELAQIIAPRPFLVERGHRDGVGVDEWVSYEYAKVRRFYDEAGIGDRTGIAFFNGPHRVDGPAALEFLRRFLGR